MSVSRLGLFTLGSLSVSAIPSVAEALVEAAKESINEATIAAPESSASICLKIGLGFVGLALYSAAIIGSMEQCLTGRTETLDDISKYIGSFFHKSEPTAPHRSESGEPRPYGGLLGILSSGEARELSRKIAH